MQAALDSDDGAPRLFSGANWALRQAFSVVDTRPFQAWQPSGRALHEAECMQVRAPALGRQRQLRHHA